jgi:DNA-binding NarL/FixJ family response regulator
VERMRVLVADDNGLYGAQLSRFVACQPDMEVIGLASDGGEAIHLASLFRPEVVLMDLCMPGIDGFEATRVLTKTHRDVRVIALSAHRSGDSESRSVEAGAAAFVRKADVDEQLIGVIRGLARDRSPVTPPLPEEGRDPA